MHTQDQHQQCVTCHAAHPFDTHTARLAPLLLPRLGAPAVAITASNMKQPNKQAHTPLMCHDAT